MRDINRHAEVVLGGVDAMARAAVAPASTSQKVMSSPIRLVNVCPMSYRIYHQRGVPTDHQHGVSYSVVSYKSDFALE